MRLPANIYSCSGLAVLTNVLAQKPPDKYHYPQIVPAHILVPRPLTNGLGTCQWPGYEDSTRLCISSE